MGTQFAFKAVLLILLIQNFMNDIYLCRSAKSDFFGFLVAWFNDSQGFVAEIIDNRWDHIA